ncbi:MAG: sigma-70 family RNA polymerase sigma factor [Bacteroidota bacterium]
MFKVQVSRWSMKFFPLFVSVTEKQIHSYYNCYFKRMVLIANEYVKDLDLAQDLVQDVFVHLLRKKEESIDNPEAYFFNAIRYKSLDSLKTKNIHSIHQKEIYRMNEESYFEEALEYADLAHFLMASINSLPDKQQLIFKKSRLEGKTNTEIADELNLSKRTVETQVSKGLKTLKAQLVKLKIMLFFL